MVAAVNKSRWRLSLLSSYLDKYAYNLQTPVYQLCSQSHKFSDCASLHSRCHRPSLRPFHSQISNLSTTDRYPTISPRPNVHQTRDHSPERLSVASLNPHGQSPQAPADDPFHLEASERNHDHKTPRLLSALRIKISRYCISLSNRYPQSSNPRPSPSRNIFTCQLPRRNLRFELFLRHWTDNNGRDFFGGVNKDGKRLLIQRSSLLILRPSNMSSQVSNDVMVMMGIRMAVIP